VQQAIPAGRPLLLEHLGSALPPILAPLLEKDVNTGQGGKAVPTIKMFGVFIPYDPRFRLYITTSHPHPTFHADVLDSVSVVNFAVTSQVRNNPYINTFIMPFNYNYKQPINTIRGDVARWSMSGYWGSPWTPSTPA
jgi:hypothetical protein